MTGNPRRSRQGAAQTLTDELNQTLRSTVTQYRLVCRIVREWAHIAFTEDVPVQLDPEHWLHVGLDLYLGELDEERGQFRNHVFNAIFAYLDSTDRKNGAVLEYHLHQMDLPSAGPTLVPHLHVRRSDRPRQHIYVGRCCMEDLLEYLIREEGVPIPPTSHPDGTPLTGCELMDRATTRLHDGRAAFHARFKTWHGMTPVSGLPGPARRLLDQLR